MADKAIDCKKRGKYHRPSLSIEIVYGQNHDDLHSNEQHKVIKHRKTKSLTEKFKNKFNPSIFNPKPPKIHPKLCDASYKHKLNVLTKENKHLQKQLQQYQQHNNTQNTNTNTNPQWNISNQKKIAILLVFTALIVIIFADYYLVNSSVAFTTFTLSTLSFMGIHLLLEHILESIVLSFNISHRVYENTACMRDIMNNIIIVFLFLASSDYGVWWRPSIWGCYLTDLVILFKKFNVITPSWLVFVFCHHFSVGVFLLILNYTVEEYNACIQIAIVIFITSNTWGVLSVIWKTFEWKLYRYSTVITFVLQRMHRASCFVYSFYSMDLQMFFEYPYRYVVLFVFALWMELFDIYFQLRSLMRFWGKQSNESC
eukprot:317776_1